MKFGVARLFALLILGIVFLGNFASAYYLPPVRMAIESVTQGLVDIFEPILGALFGGQYGWSADLLFERFLIYIILLSVIYLSLGRVPLFFDKKFVRWIVAIVVPLLGVRFLDYSWILAIVTQYAVLTIALAAVLPFLIYFFFLYNTAGDYPGARKIAWLLFILVYLGLWSTSSSPSNSAVYFWTMICSLVFLFFDGTIYRYYLRQQMKNAGETDKWKHITELRRDISRLEEAMGAGHIPAHVGKRLIEKKKKTINWIIKRS